MLRNAGNASPTPVNRSSSDSRFDEHRLSCLLTAAGATPGGEPSSSPGSETRAMYMPPPAGGAPNNAAADC